MLLLTNFWMTSSGVTLASILNSSLFLGKTSASLHISCGELCNWLLVIWSCYHFSIWCRIEWQSANEVSASRVSFISPEPQQCNRLQKVVMKSFAVLPSYLYKWKFLWAVAWNTSQNTTPFWRVMWLLENKMTLQYPSLHRIRHVFLSVI